MVELPLIVIEKVVSAVGAHDSYFGLVQKALSALGPVPDVGGVIAATFSNPERFPSLAVRVAAELKLPAATPAFDLQMACSAYPYAVYLAGRLAADTGKKVLVVNGDRQLPLVDVNDHATGEIFSDAMTVSVVSCDSRSSAKSRFEFLSRAEESLSCSATGPIRMDGMKVFTFVATEVRALLASFPSAHLFIPHQANPYMVRQLAKSLGLSDQLLTLDPALKNPGSASIPLTIAANRQRVPEGGALATIAGFGAGYSAAVGLVKIL